MIDLNAMQKVFGQSIKKILTEHLSARFRGEKPAFSITLILDDGTRLAFSSRSEIDMAHEGTPVCANCKGSGWIDPDGVYGNPSHCIACNVLTYRVPRP